MGISLARPVFTPFSAYNNFWCVVTSRWIMDRLNIFNLNSISKVAE